ncbi:MAG TPA: hypothetical protein VE130_04500 [Nitrososphaeraceae archaeon]|nr:hypothetical protein [Nitrososphaeraceae archaeon]
MKIEIGHKGMSSVISCRDCGFQLEIDDQRDAKEMVDIHKKIGCRVFNERFSEFT